MPPQSKQAAPDFIPYEESSPDFIPATEVSGPAMRSPAPPPSMSAPESPVGRWFEDAENDLRQGGGRTVIGRALGHLQGEGNKGYTGMESGTSPATAEFMGSPVLGPMKMAQGAQNIGSGHPVTGGSQLLKGAMETATIPSAFIAPEAGATGNEIATVLKIPNKAHAGRVFADVADAAKNTPVTMTNTQPALQRFEDLTMAGGRRSKPFTQLAKRISQPDPVNYPEARDFYTNVGDATSPTKLQKIMGRGMKPTMLRQGTITRHALGSDIADAAAAAGKGQEYSSAMSEYANAMKIQKALRVAGLLGAGEAARRTGLLGNWIHRTALQQ